MVFQHKKVLFVFSDPGGAKPCLALIDMFKDSEVLAISDRVYDFYKDFNVEVLLVNEEDEFNLVKEFKPSLIFTGTSYTSEIEKRFLKLSKEMGIVSLSFVDHWTAISQRFVFKDGEKIIPEEIWVIDERAKRIAVDEGLPASILKVKSNPFHKWLALWKSAHSKQSFFDALGIKLKGEKILVFVPDPLSNINGKEIYGFDEYSCITELLNLFEDFATELIDWKVIIKPHPNQNLDDIKSMVSNSSKFILVSTETNMNEILYHGDAIMGFFSSALLEADVMQKTVLRFIPTDIENDPFKGLAVGQIVTKDNIVSELLKLNYGSKK